MLTVFPLDFKHFALFHCSGQAHLFWFASKRHILIDWLYNLISCLFVVQDKVSRLAKVPYLYFMSSFSLPAKQRLEFSFDLLRQPHGKSVSVEKLIGHKIDLNSIAL